MKRTEPTRPLTLHDLTPTIQERIQRARRAVLLVSAGLTPDYDAGGEFPVEDVEIDAQTAKAMIEALAEADLDLFWLLRLDEQTLNQPAPSDDERENFERAGGAA